MRYFSLLSFTDEDAEIAQAETEAVLGPARFEGRLAFSAAGRDVTPAAHINWCAQELARAPSLDALCEQVQSRGLGADDFKIVVLKPSAGQDMKSPEIAARVAEHLQGRPDLSHPKTQFAVAFPEGAVCFGRIISEADKSWRGHVKRPHQYSNALPVRLARAMVNMVVRPGDTVLDPCCGAGTLLIEAASIGAVVFGSDANRRMVGATRENLAHFGLQGTVEVARAEEIVGRFDVVVTDLPYGRTTQADEALYRAVLPNLARLAPRAAIVMGGPCEPVLQAAGYDIVRVARQFKGTLTRHVYICRSRVAEHGVETADAGESQSA